MTPRVSVIVPNYNHGRFLAQRIESILRQSFREYELLILDDASTDNSRQIIAAYNGDPRVRFVPNEKNSGSPFVQWNRGIRLAAGELVWLAESDDFAAPTLLESLLQQFDDRPQLGLAYCQSWRVDDDGNTTGSMVDFTSDLDPVRWTRSWINRGADECGRYLVRKNTIPNASAVLFRRSTYLASGGAPEDMRLMGDWMTWASMLLRTDVAFVAEPLNHFRHHPSTMRSRSSWDTYERERWRIQRYLVSRGVVTRENVRALSREAANLYLSSLRLAQRNELFGRARTGWMTYSPFFLRAPFAAAGQIIRRAQHRLA